VKIFVAGKVGQEKSAREAMSILSQAGHEISFDWTAIPHLKPYDENSEASRQAALLESQGVLESDALVLLAHDKGIGMYVELGMAIASGKPIYVVGSETSRTMFLYHPLVRRVSSISSLLNVLGSSNGQYSRKGKY
jgi:nucleoside 2-deoxyribosyltransferase